MTPEESIALLDALRRASAAVARVNYEKALAAHPALLSIPLED